MVLLIVAIATLFVLLSLRAPVPTSLRNGMWVVIASVALGIAARQHPQWVRLAVLVASGLLVSANWATVSQVNMTAAYRVSAGPDRPTLEELADSSPHVAISRDVAMLFDLGAALDGASLLVPDRTIAGSVRAFTTIDAAFGATPTGLTLESDRRHLGYFHERPVVLVGSGEAYVWIDSNPRAVFIVGVDDKVLRDAG